MSVFGFVTEQASRLWRFLGFFQPPFLRGLHLSVVLLVAVQLISSTGMSSYAEAGSLAAFLGSTHIYSGLFLGPLALFFTLYCWRTRGIKRFYGYLWGETEQLRKDIVDSLHFRLVPPRPGGLATLVQGLGFGALLLAAFSGLVWFAAWKNHLPAASALKDIHEACGTLVAVYLAGHGGMALLHFILWQRNVPGRKEQ